MLPCEFLSFESCARYHRGYTFFPVTPAKILKFWNFFVQIISRLFFNENMKKKKTQDARLKWQLLKAHVQYLHELGLPKKKKNPSESGRNQSAFKAKKRLHRGGGKSVGKYILKQRIDRMVWTHSVRYRWLSRLCILTPPSSCQKPVDSWFINVLERALMKKHS